MGGHTQSKLNAKKKCFQVFSPPLNSETVELERQKATLAAARAQFENECKLIKLHLAASETRRSRKFSFQLFNRRPQSMAASTTSKFQEFFSVSEKFAVELSGINFQISITRSMKIYSTTRKRFMLTQVDEKNLSSSKRALLKMSSANR